MLTSHSLWPWEPSKSRSLTATGWAFKPGLSLSSMNPLWTGPNPPSPRKLLVEKFWVITFSSCSVSAWMLEPAREMDRSSDSAEELNSVAGILENDVCFITSFLGFFGVAGISSFSAAGAAALKHPVKIESNAIFIFTSIQLYISINIFHSPDLSILGPTVTLQRNRDERERERDGKGVVLKKKKKKNQMLSLYRHRRRGLQTPLYIYRNKTPTTACTGWLAGSFLPRRGG